MRYALCVMRCALGVMCCALLISNTQSYALSGDSILATIEGLLPAIVTVRAENVGLYSTSDNPVVKQLLIGRYSRTGGGVIIDSNGLIVTNAHTVAEGAKIKVALHDNTVLEGQIISTNVDDDLALIRINSSFPLSVINLAPEDSIKLGATVYNVGGSEILRGAVSEGTIIGLGTKNNQVPAAGESLELIKINFDVYQGDSGGAIIDKQGRLVGLIIAGSTKGGKISLAIPSGKIKKYCQQYINK